MNDGIKILIADDHSTIRTGLKHILSHAFSNVTFGEAITGSETLKKISGGDWDLVILDINMPGKDGLEVLTEIKENDYSVRVLILSMYTEDQFSVRCIKAGAFGYLSKTADDQQIVEAVQTILNGRKYISPDVAQLLSIELVQGHEGQPHEYLSDRELQTFLKIAVGKSVTKVADELNLSVSTVNTYRFRVFKKMNAKSNADLIRYALDNKLI